MANPTRELAVLTSLLNTPNLSVLLVKVTIQGQVQIVATGPNPVDIVKVLLLPNTVQNIIDFAPVEWWQNSSSLHAAVQNGWIDVVTPVPLSQAPVIGSGPKFIVDPPGAAIGDMLVYNGLGWDLLHPGPSGYVVTSNGAGIIPTYQPSGSGSGASEVVTLNCGPTVNIGDVVHVLMDNTVEKTTAGSGNYAVGVVQSKPSITTAEVVLSGQTPPIFSALTAGFTYYLGMAGDLVPNPPALLGAFAQKIGTAQSSDTLLVSVSEPRMLKQESDNVAMVTDQSTELSAFTVIGSFTFEPGSYTAVDFVTTASVTSSALTGEIQLWNLMDIAQVALHTVTTTTPTRLITPLPLPSTTVIYEVRHRVLGGSVVNDRVNTTWAGLRLASNEWSVL